MKAREANYFDVGVQGRKTGITLQENERDEYGLERIDGIFSSPVHQPALPPPPPPPPPPAPESDLPRTNGITQPIENGRDSSPQATAFAVKRGRGRPPKPRTPIVQKTNRESESEGDDEQDDQQRVSKVVRNDKDDMSPRKAPAHTWKSSRPSPMTPRMNIPPSMRKEGMNETGLFSGTPKRGPGRPRKNPSGENLPVGMASKVQQQHQHQQQEPSLFMTPPKRGPGRPRKNPLPVEQQQQPSMSTVMPANDSPQMQLDDEESILETQHGYSAQPGYSVPPESQTQRHEEQQQPVKRKRGRPRKSDTGGTPASSSATLQHSTAPPMLSQTAREYTADVLNGAGIYGVGSGGGGGVAHPIDPVILQQAAVQAARVMQNNAHTYPTGNAYAATEHALSTTTTAMDGPPAEKRKRGRPKGSKNKPKNPTIRTNGDDRVEAWEEDPGVVNGPVKLWDPDLESSLDYLVEDELAYSTQAITSLQVPQSTFQYAKTLTLPFFGSGIVEIPPGGIKRPKNSRRMQMVFFVAQGKVRVEIAGTQFGIGKGGMFQVPRGNFYSISNDSTIHTAQLFFAQGCEMSSNPPGPPSNENGPVNNHHVVGAGGSGSGVGGGSHLQQYPSGNNLHSGNAAYDGGRNDVVHRGHGHGGQHGQGGVYHHGSGSVYGYGGGGGMMGDR